MTVSELIELIEKLIQLLLEQRQRPPAAVMNLSVVVTRRNSMSTATLNWDDPVNDDKGQPLPAGDLVSMNVYDSLSPTPSIPIANVPATNGPNTFTTGDLVAGSHNFTVVGVDKKGKMSLPSNIATGVVEAEQAAPAAVTNLTVTINP